MASELCAQTQGSARIEGHVYDTGGEPLPGANVRLEGTRYGAATNGDGFFVILEVSPGNYEVVVSYVGYEPSVNEIDVSDGQAVTLDVILEEEAALGEEVLVTGTRLARARALEDKRLSANIREVSLADDIGKLPDQNLADALSRMAGVSVQQGVGDAQYVSIRGIAPDLNQVNVNGQASAISDVDARAGRSGPLDVVGAGEFARIEVIKTLTPDLDAQGLGGQINVATPSALDQGRRFAFAQADYGANGTNDQGDFSLNLGFGDLLLTNKLGVYVGGSFSHRDFVFDRIEGGWTQLEDGSIIPDRQELKFVDETRERYSVSGNVEYAFSPQSNVYARAVFNQVNDDGLRDEVESQVRGSVELTSLADGRTDGVQVQLKSRVQESRRNIFNLTVGAEQAFGVQENFLWEPSLTYSRASEDRDINFINTEINDRLPGTFESSNYLYRIDAEGRFDPNNISFDKIRFDGGLQKEDLFLAQNDLSWRTEDVDLVGRAGSLRLKLGGKMTLRDRSVDEYSDRWGANDDWRLSEFVKDGPTNFRDNYTFGPVADVAAINRYVEEHSELFSYLEEQSLVNSAEDDYDAKESVYAAYALGEIGIGPVTLLGGLRVEHTDLTMAAMQATEIDDEFQGLEPREFSEGYTNLFPNLQVRYALTDAVIARAAFTTSIGRPDFVDLAPITELEAVEVDPDVFIGSVEEGNPALKPFEATNLDASLEYYFSEGALISAGVFYKQIDNPVFTRRLRLENVEYGGRFFERLNLRRTENAEAGSIRGVELNYQHQFVFLPGPLSGLGLALNAAFMDSEVTVFDRDEELPFFTQPDHILNAQLFYENAPVEVRVAYQRNGENLIGLGGSAEGDIFEDVRQTLDAKVTFQLPWNAFVFGEVKNLIGEDRRRFQARSGQLYLDEHFGAIYRVGMSWKL